MPRPYSQCWSAVTKRAVNESLPQAVGAYVEWLLAESGWQVRDPAGQDDKNIPIAPRHIAILFRRFVSWGNDVTRDYVHSLEIRNIPHLLWGAK